MQGDNELYGQPCDNISGKNETYCELTAIYWAWKNLRKLYPSVKYIGLYHYRRFMTFGNTADNITGYSVNFREISNILESGRIILPKRAVFPYSIMEQYQMRHVSEDYLTTKEIIRTKFPDYYEDFMSFMNGNKMSLFNMFIMKYEDFSRYCEWLFAVLAEIESVTPLQSYNAYQRRALAFMAERLLNVYAMKNNLKPYYTSVFNYDDDGKNTSVQRPLPRRIIRYWHAELAFRMGYSNYCKLRDAIKKFLPNF